MLEVQSSCKLAVARVVNLRQRNNAKGGAAERCAWPTEDRRVQDVVEFTANLEGSRLANREDLEEPGLQPRIELLASPDDVAIGLGGEGQTLDVGRRVRGAAASPCAYHECAAGVFVAGVDVVAIAAVGNACRSDDVHATGRRDHVAVGHAQHAVQLPSADRQPLQVRALGKCGQLISAEDVGQQVGVAVLHRFQMRVGARFQMPRRISFGIPVRPAWQGQVILLRARDQESATLERAVMLVNRSEQPLDFLFQISLIREADITLLNLAIARNHDGGGESDQPSELLG